MGILSRFREVMKVNVNSLLDKSEDPIKVVDEYMRNLNDELRKVKAETASVLADERRSKKALDECQTEIDKLQRYAEKSVADGNEGDAKKFLERKRVQAEKQHRLQVSYDLISSNAASIKQIQDKLESFRNQLEARRVELNGKWTAAQAQELMNSISSPSGDGDSIFGKMEAEVNKAYDEAMAIAEIRAEANDNLDDLFTQFEKSTHMQTEDELAAIKEKIKNKD
ncbi:PspA/IM30 family protein [Paenibacillus sp. ACRRX]|uniref:PspA/IM30 family protein n=1 Tax=Paenibacillus sp. ACRRX TaxID=2918206 RepID=UPI001EF6C888|nr:PspA/IM30 family protein [Paenibacillus sp. ACRRX]MCG7408769.1 PspA/IM30 family protein [Paenibacillus sp. ACRRX]